MKNNLQKPLILKTLLIAVSLILPLSVQAETLVNLGTLDVHPTAGGQAFHLDLNPGQKVQQQIQVSNFSDKPMNVEIYAADANQQSSGNFIANDQNQRSEDIFPWINLPTNRLSLASGESKILSVNISTPSNAGVGMHTGAIMVKEKINAGENNLSVEKGVRIYTNIKGAAAPNLVLGTHQVIEDENFLTYSNTVTNAGNTDLKGDFTFNLYNQNNQIVGTQSKSLYLKPQTSQPIFLSTDKPAFGIYHSEITNDILNTSTTDLGTKFLTPPATAPIAAAAVLLIAVIALAATRKKLSLPKFKMPTIDLAVLTRQFALQKAAAFFALVLVVGVAAFGSTSLPKNYLKADLLGTSKSYLTTIRLGNLTNRPMPKSMRTLWQGNIKFENALVSIQGPLNQEPTDKFFLNSAQNTLYFNAVTDPDNDGIELIVTPTSDEPVKAIYKNSLSSEEFPFLLDNTIKRDQTFNFKADQISFHSAASTITAQKEIITDLNSTEEISNLEASGEVSVKPLKDPELAFQLKILQEVISDLPATGETLSEYILNSNYVQDVISENQTTTVTADPSLIAALQDSPQTISDITSTEELNFLFIPDEKVRFASQNFSFNEKKIVTQDLGRIVFVQNKADTWNTYLSVTDLVSVSGKGAINASNISIDPGRVKILSGDNANSSIDAGRTTTLHNANDTALLVNVHPNNADQVIFSINPKMTINVPAKTLPGTYRGQMSIKVL